jgi:hypothetical protein
MGKTVQAKPAQRERKTTLSVDKAFHKLLTIFEPALACRQLDDAIQTGKILLWVKHELDKTKRQVNPFFFKAHLQVAAQAEKNGQWIACVKAIRSLEHPVEEYAWTVSGVENFLTQQTTKRGAGGKPQKFDHGQILLQAIVVILKQAFPNEKRDWRQLLAAGLPRHNNKPTLAELCGRVVESASNLNKVPSDSTFKAVLGPLFNALKSHA